MILLSCFIWSLTVSGGVMALQVKGRVGGEVLIQCSYTFGSSNIKYFCIDPCDDVNVLVKSQHNRATSRSGRYSLWDSETGTFNVTISDLRITDTGMYRCAVERIGIDTYTKVSLTVSEAPAPPSPTTTVSPDPSLSTEEMRTTKTPSVTTGTATTPTTSHLPFNREMYLIYIGAGLTALVVFLVIFLLILIKLKRANRKPTESSSQDNPKIKINYPTKSSHSANQMLRSADQQEESPSSQDPGSVYCNISPTAAADTQHQDALHYATVSFSRRGDDGEVSETGNCTKESFSESLYSNITAPLRTSSAEDPNTAIYSTVKKPRPGQK